VALAYRERQGQLVEKREDSIRPLRRGRLADIRFLVVVLYAIDLTGSRLNILSQRTGSFASLPHGAYLMLRFYLWQSVRPEKTSSLMLLSTASIKFLICSISRPFRTNP
jgi:hypothetical protein